jgi:hypothetical protein
VVELRGAAMKTSALALIAALGVALLAESEGDLLAK